MKIAALIPVKGFDNAKQRLSALLSAAERADLAETMMRDVVAETVAARGLVAVYVVTGNRYVRDIATSLGARTIMEEEETGETGAVTFALAELKRRGIDVALVIPADMPLVRAADIEQVIAAAPSAAPCAVLVPSHDRMGTNALLLAPPDVIRLRFGYDSFSYHMSQAAGLPLVIVENERIALDIDEPQDLERFIAAGGGPGASYARAMEMRAAARGTGA